MKQFNINKDATLPYLEIEPVMNGRYNFRKLYEAIQCLMNIVKKYSICVIFDFLY